MNLNFFFQDSQANLYSPKLKGKRTVIAFGRNDFGQLGVGDTENRRVPTQIKDLNFQSCHILEAGDYHSAFLNEHNELFMWGNNESGQLGIGIDQKKVLRPHPVDTKAIAEEADKLMDDDESRLNKMFQGILEVKWDLASEDS